MDLLSPTESPLQEGFLLERTPPPCTILIFGACGDLTRRKLLPALCDQAAVRAQYGAGWIAGQAVPAYRDERSVDPASTVETFCALKLMLDDWRWADVRLYLRTGKRVSEIAVTFKKVPHLRFRQTPADQIEPNLLVLRIQPDEGISLRFEARLPGGAVRLRSLHMDFHYGSAFGVAPPEAYERLLLDCMIGDPTLFSRRDAAEASWQGRSPPPPLPKSESCCWRRNKPIWSWRSWGPRS